MKPMIIDDSWFRLLVQSVKDYALFVIDKDGNVQSWNEGAEQLKMYKSNEIIGKHFSVFYTPEDLEAGKPAKELLQAIEHGRVEDEFWRVRKDGSMFWASVSISPIYDAHHEHVGFAKLTRDLTDKKIAEEGLLQVYKESARLKSEFLANISHEIRTPLNGVVAAGELLMNTTLESEQKELLKIMMHSGEALIRVINDILDYSKMDTEEMKLLDEPFDLHDTIIQLVNTYQVTLQKQVVLKVTIEDSVPIHVSGDAVRLYQVLGNIVNNALKFTEIGSVHVRVFIQNSSSEDCRVHFEVSDTGIGMTDESMTRLFTPFFQGDKSFSTKRYPGTGLGLSICKRLVGLMEGQIDVQSQIGVGSTFSFNVKFRATNSSQLVTKSDTPLQIAVPCKKSARILLAEDNLVNQKIAVKMLTRLGYTDSNIIVVENGRLAVDLFTESSFDVVILDCQMPVLDGYDATRKIRDIDKDVPIIAMTANAMKEDEAKCLAAGMNDYISKPVSLAKISKVMNTWLKI